MRVRRPSHDIASHLGLAEIRLGSQCLLEGFERFGGAALLRKHHPDVRMRSAGTHRLRERLERFVQAVLLSERESQVDVVAFQLGVQSARFAEGSLGFAPTPVLIMVVAVVVPQPPVARRLFQRLLEMTGRQFVVAEPSVEHRQSRGNSRRVRLQRQHPFVLGDRLRRAIALIELPGGGQT